MAYCMVDTVVYRNPNNIMSYRLRNRDGFGHTIGEYEYVDEATKEREIYADGWKNELRLRYPFWSREWVEAAVERCLVIEEV